MFINKQLKSFNAQNHSIVIWSEARHYWSTYQTLVKYFQKNNIDFIYLASHNDDMGLVACENSLYIKSGKKAFSFLNDMTADIVIMTTPNLGDLAVKRSKMLNTT